LSFECPSCEGGITVKFLSVGEEAECKHCGFHTVVPDDAIQVDGAAAVALPPPRKLAPFGDRRLPEAETQDSPAARDWELTSADRERATRLIEAEADFVRGLLYSTVAALAAAVGWAAFAVLTTSMWAPVAVGVGAAVGYGMLKGGKGTTPTFGVAAAGLAVVAIVVGNSWAACGFLARANHLSVFQLIRTLPLSAYVGLTMETFELMDVLFYGLAVYWAYRAGVRQVSDAELWLYATGRGDGPTG
jgi:hypothetical protein